MDMADKNRMKRETAKTAAGSGRPQRRRVRFLFCALLAGILLFTGNCFCRQREEKRSERIRQAYQGGLALIDERYPALIREKYLAAAELAIPAGYFLDADVACRTVETTVHDGSIEAPAWTRTLEIRILLDDAFDGLMDRDKYEYMHQFDSGIYYSDLNVLPKDRYPDYYEASDFPWKYFPSTKSYLSEKKTVIFATSRNVYSNPYGIKDYFECNGEEHPLKDGAGYDHPVWPAGSFTDPAVGEQATEDMLKFWVFDRRNADGSKVYYRKEKDGKNTVFHYMRLDVQNVVTDVTFDRRRNTAPQSGTGKTPQGSGTASDPFHASDYTHPEDLYEWFYDDFWDYEDAEEYWEAHQ